MTKLRNDAPPPEEGDGRPAADPAKGRWSAQEMLLAAMVDEQRLSRWLFVQANSRGGKTAPPAPIKRPGAAPARKRMSLKDRLRLDPRMRLTAAKSRQMTPAEHAPYADTLLDARGEVAIGHAMRELHTGREKAQEAVRLARLKRGRR